VRAAHFYVAPNGTASGPGTSTQPYALRTALSGQVGRPGDTFWLRGGTYNLGYIETMIHGAPGAPITFRQIIGEQARVDGALVFWNSIGHVIVRDFELYGSDTNRITRQTNVGYNPTDINIRDSGVISYVPNMSFINLTVHDHVRHGFYISPEASNNVVYGCVVYNNGWVGPDNSSGHNFYIQNNAGSKVLAENITFNNAGVNFQVYDDHQNGQLRNVTMEGNVAFNASVLSTTRAYRDWIIGVDAPSVSSDGIVFKDNMGYHAPGSRTTAQAQLGREGVNGRLVATGNYLTVPVQVNNWQTAVFSNNVVALQSSGYVVDLQQSQTLTALGWNHNTYYRPSTGSEFHRNSSTFQFGDWKTTTGFDSSSSYAAGAMTGTKVFVRPNIHEPGRANIVIYNWDGRDSVDVDIRSVLPIGAGYDVRNAEDFFAAPVLGGTFDGRPLRLPMRGLTVAKPNGPFATPAPTGPQFNVFVLLPREEISASPPSLRISRVGGSVMISWPADAGNYVLQSLPLGGAPSGWNDIAAVPTVANGQYVVTEPAGRVGRLYRLRG
jgi:hypothetical protein